MHKNKFVIFLIILIFAITCGIVIINTKHKNGKPTKNNETITKETISKNSETIKPSVEPTKEKEKINKYEIPILMYHYIRNIDDLGDDNLGKKLSVSPNQFDSQLKWLNKNGFKSVDLDYILDPYKTDFKPVIITFDDGYRDAYTDAFPILKKNNFSGTFYLITDDVGYPYYMTWDMAREMKKDGMVFGSHTLTHPDLAKANEKDLDAQLRYSKSRIEKELDTVVNDFCYPSGKYNDQTIAKLKELGYKTATTTHTGITNQDSSLFELKRIRVQDDTDLSKTLGDINDN